MLYYSAKELEHYQRVRHTFESPSKTQKDKASLPPPNNSLSQDDQHGHSPVPAKRPGMKARSSTIKPKSNNEPQGKGKGKATQWTSEDDDDDDDDDDAYVTSNDFADTPERRKSGVNGAFGEDLEDERLYA